MTSASTIWRCPGGLHRRPSGEPRQCGTRFRWFKRHRERRMEKFLTRFAAQLQLDDDQQQQFELLVAELKRAGCVWRSKRKEFTSKWLRLLRTDV